MCDDGIINVIDINTYVVVQDVSIFDVNQEILVNGFCIENLEIFSVVESQSIKFYKLDTYELSEVWKSPFTSKTICSCKTPDNKHLLTGDDSGRIVIYDLSKTINQAVSLEIPYHNPSSLMNLMIYTTTFPGEQQIITCTANGDVDIWNRNTGKLIKKYTMTTIASNFNNIIENIITAMCLYENNQSMIYFGSKDTMIYPVNFVQISFSEPFTGNHGKIFIYYDR